MLVKDIHFPLLLVEIVVVEAFSTVSVLAKLTNDIQKACLGNGIEIVATIANNGSFEDSKFIVAAFVLSWFSFASFFF